MNIKNSATLLLGGLAFSPQAISAQAEKSDKNKPNILFILLDDLGKEWISTYGADGIETPTFDRLAKTGMKFDNCYSMPQSTPTRACLLTGQYPYRNGWVNHWDVPRWGAKAHFDETCNPSIPRYIREAGYATASAGKWQIDDFRIEPDAMVRAGFDEYCMWTGSEVGVPESDERYWDPYIHTKNGSQVYKGEFGADVFADFLIDFMRNNRDGVKPMFMYFPMCLPHTPLVATPHEPNAKEKMDCHRAMVRYVDYTIGRLINEIEYLGIRNNTIIVVTTDNGTAKGITGSINGTPVKGGKSEVTENGINAPLIVSCPTIVPQGVTTDALVDFTDIMPTFVDIAGGKLDDKYSYDGQSFYALLKGDAKDSPRTWIMSMGGKNEAKVSEKGVENKYAYRDRVIRDKRYKLYVSIKGEAEKLFDLKKDPYEKNNIIDRKDMEKIIERLFEPTKTMFKKDMDPIYKNNPAQSWDVKPSVESQKWKL